MGFLQCVRATFVRQSDGDSSPQVDSFLVSSALSSLIPKAGDSLSETGPEMLRSLMERLQLSEVSAHDIYNQNNCPFVPAEWIVKGFDTAGNPVYHDETEGLSIQRALEISKKPGFGPTITNHNDL